MTFFIIVFSIYFCMHLLVGWRSAVQLSWGWDRALWMMPVILLLTFSPLLIHNLPESWSEGATRRAWWLTYLWMGIIFYLFWLQLSTLLLDGLVYAINRSWQRHGWQGWPMLALVLGSTSLIVAIGLQAATRIHVERVTIESPRIEHPLRIVFLSDIHLGAMSSPSRTARLARLVKDQEPDLVLFGGDQLNDHLHWLGPEERLLAAIAPPLGMYGVLGNHEYYVGKPDSLEFHALAEITLLRNAVVDLPERNLQLLGIDDPAWAFTDQDYMARQLDELLPLLRPDAFAILITHRPWLWEEKVVPAGIDLQVAGHTHNGQLYPFVWFSRLHYPFVYGHYQQNGQHLIVTSGAGIWGPPLRVLSQSEIVVIEVLPPI